MEEQITLEQYFTDPANTLYKLDIFGDLYKQNEFGSWALIKNYGLF